MRDDARRMAREIAELKQAVRDLQTASRLGHASIDGGALVVKDADGVVRQMIGRQTDGTYTVVDTNGITPPTPADPVLIAAQAAVTVSSYGTTADGSEWPKDFAAIEAHVSTTSGFTPSAATKVGEFGTGGGSLVVHAEPGAVLYAVLVGRNTSGALGPVSGEVSATPLAVVSAEELAAIDEAVAGLTSRIGFTEDDVAIQQGAVASAQTAASDAQTTADAASTAAAAAQSTADAASADAATAQSIATQAQTDADTAQSIATAAQTAADSAQADVDAVEGRVTTAEGDISSLTTRVTTAETDITAVEGRVGTAEGDITAVESRVTTAEGSLSSLDTRVDGAEGTITLHESRLDTAETDINTVEGRVTTAESDISSVQGRVTTAEGTLSTHETRIDSAETTITTHESRLDGAESDITDVTTIANAKNSITYSTAAPGSTPNTAGDLWWVLLGSQVVGLYEGLGGTSWSQRTMADAVIANLDAGKITSGFIAAARIASGTIDTGRLAAFAVTAAKLAAGAVEAGKIAAGAVEAGNLAAGAVIAGNIAAGAVQTADLDAEAVTADKIAANAVTVGKIAAGAVTAGSLAADAIDGKTITGAVFQTAESGNRIVIAPNIDGGTNDAMQIYYAHTGMTPAQVRVQETVTPTEESNHLSLDSGNWNEEISYGGSSIILKTEREMDGAGSPTGVYDRSIAYTSNHHFFDGDAEFWGDVTINGQSRAFATAAGSAFVATPSSSVTIPFPVGRFSAAPIVTCTCTPSTNVALVALVSNVTATSFDAYFYGLGGTWTTGSVSVFWQAQESH